MKPKRALLSPPRAREQEKLVQAQPDYGPALCVLGLDRCGSRPKRGALCAKAGVPLSFMPVAKDSINGVHMIEYFAVIAAWVGDKDLACEQSGEG